MLRRTSRRRRKRSVSAETQVPAAHHNKMATQSRPASLAPCSAHFATRRWSFRPSHRTQRQKSPQSDTHFRILLKMWDEMAVLSSKYLKPNDFINVSGNLGSYTNKDQNGSFRLNHELVVKELNYIARHGQGSSETEDHEESQSDGGETGMEKYRERLHLWQLYFVNPYDWWDNRNSKLNSRQPDFKHKDTGEALWLSPNDPPWIKTETHRLDLRMADQGEGRQAGYRRGVSKWEYDE